MMEQELLTVEKAFRAGIKDGGKAKNLDVMLLKKTLVNFLT